MRLRPSCFALFLACTTLAGAVETPPKPKLDSKVIDWATLQVKKTKTGERRELFDGPTGTLRNFEGHVTTIRPGEVPHAAHRHPDEEMILIKEGTLEVTINGVSKQAGAGSVFFYAANDLHGMKNVGTTDATYFVFRFVTERTATAKP